MVKDASQQAGNVDIKGHPKSETSYSSDFLDQVQDEISVLWEFANNVRFLVDNHWMARKQLNSNAKFTCTHLQATLQLIFLLPHFSRFVSFQSYDLQSEIIDSHFSIVGKYTYGPASFPIRLLLRLRCMQLIDDPFPFGLNISRLLYGLECAFGSDLIRIVPMSEIISNQGDALDDDLTYYSFAEGSEILASIDELVSYILTDETQKRESVLDDPSWYIDYDDSDADSRDIDADETDQETFDDEIARYEYSDSDYHDSRVGNVSKSFWSDDEDLS